MFLMKKEVVAVVLLTKFITYAYVFSLYGDQQLIYFFR